LQKQLAIRPRDWNCFCQLDFSFVVWREACTQRFVFAVGRGS
jgi:hypothetical protein